MANVVPVPADSRELMYRYPQDIDWNINIPEETLCDLLDAAVLQYGNRPCIDFMGRRLTYREFGNLVDRTARGLERSGVGQGTKIGLSMSNTPYYPILFFAAMRVGATVVNYNPTYTKEEMRTQIRDSGTDVVVTLDLKAMHDKAIELLDEQEIQKVVVCRFADMLPILKSYGFSFMKRAMVAPPDVHRGVVDFRQLSGGDDYTSVHAAKPDEVAVIQYTTGSTGTPKGAMLTHFNLVAAATQVEEFLNNPSLESGCERVLAALPYFHVFGMMSGMIASLKMGHEIVIVPDPRDVKDVMKTIGKKHVTVLPAVPRLMQAIVEHKEAGRHDFSSLKVVISGGSALPTSVRSAFENAVGKPGLILQGYGLSETAPTATGNPMGGVNKPQSVGIPYPRTEIKIVDPENPDKTVSLGQPGEVCIRGPQVMKGYYKRPEETAQVLTQDGWFRTGDSGYLDGDGYLHIVDRYKRMIIINGMKIAPNAIEMALGEHPSVAECVAVAVPDPRSGEAAKIFVRLKEGKTLDQQELREFLRPRLNDMEMPKHIEYVTAELPKAGVGKPDWKKLQDGEREKYKGPGCG